MVLLFEHQIIDSFRHQKGNTLIRKIHCRGCKRVLAIEVTNKLGARGECYVVKDALRTRGGVDFLFEREVWYGNLMVCPICLLAGKLPMDKPLAAEEIAKHQEVRNAESKTIH